MNVLQTKYSYIYICTHIHTHTPTEREAGRERGREVQKGKKAKEIKSVFTYSISLFLAVTVEGMCYHARLCGCLSFFKNKN